MRDISSLAGVFNIGVKLRPPDRGSSDFLVCVACFFVLPCCPAARMAQNLCVGKASIIAEIKAVWRYASLIYVAIP